MKVIAFEPEHLKRMTLQQRQHLEAGLSDYDFSILQSQGDSFTVIDGDEILACAGTIKLTHGRAFAWSYISENIGARLVSFTRATRRYLDVCGHRRIEMDVDSDFPQAHRWAEMLGFTMECPRRKSLYVDGQDCALYARVM